MDSERIRALSAQLEESRIHYLRSKILLSSLKEAVDSGKFSASATEKVNKVSHFGNLNEYLDMAQHGSGFSLGGGTLLGISTIPEYEQCVKLTNEEKKAVLRELRECIMQKNQLVCEIFGRYLQKKSRTASEENLKELVGCLKLAVAPPVVCNHLKENSDDIRTCYEEIRKCHAMLENLVEVKLQAGEPLFSCVIRLNELTAQASATKSKELLGDIKNEIVSDGGALALEVIHNGQKAEIEEKKLQLMKLREEMSHYESIKSEGFESLLDEYLLVTRQRKDKEKLKEEYVTGFDNLKEG